MSDWIMPPWMEIYRHLLAGDATEEYYNRHEEMVWNAVHFLEVLHEHHLLKPLDTFTGTQRALLVPCPLKDCGAQEGEMCRSVGSPHTIFFDAYTKGDLLKRPHHERFRVWSLHVVKSTMDST